MSFIVQIGLERILLPGLCSLVGCFLLATADQGEEWYDDEPVRGVGTRLFFGAFLCGLGLLCSDLWQRGLLHKPAEWSTWKAAYQWQWMIWIIPASMLGMSIVRILFAIPIHYAAIASGITASVASGVLLICLNETLIWQDQSANVLPWFAAGTVAILWNTMGLNSIAKAAGSRWVTLVVLAQLGCVAAIALQTYASLGEWTLAGVGAALGASMVGLLRGSSAKLDFGWQLSIVVLPLGIMAAGCLAVSHFFEPVPLPLWVTGCVLFLPAIVGATDFVIGRLWGPWVRAILAALICGLLLFAILTISKPWQSEW